MDCRSPIMNKIARVFPSKTTYSPDDDLAFFEGPGLFPPDGISKAMVSCTFTWDKPRAEQLAKEWERVCPVELSGPAYDNPGCEFSPGMFLKSGMVLTSRGCSHKCSFCFVPEREGGIRTLEIKQGNRLLDSNILACPEDHVRAVFDMLSSQKGKIGLHGGFDTRLIQDWHIDLLEGIRPKVERLYIAFDNDTKSSRERVIRAIKLIRNGAGLSLGQLRCFVLVGYKDDSISKAEERCEWVLNHGAVPFASYFRPPDEMSGKKPKEWQDLVSRWAWMPGIFGRLKREGKPKPNQRGPV